MLDKLRDLIFGLNEYEKVRIDYRFDEAKAFVIDHEIKSVQDFLLFEEINYKIKDMLRLRSSNLNKVIKDPSKNYKKADVLELLAILEKKRDDYLLKRDIKDLNTSNSKFDDSKGNSNKKANLEKKSEVKEESIVNENSKKDNLKEEAVSESFDDNSKNDDHLEIFRNDDYIIYVENGKTFYLHVKLLRTDINTLSFVKELASGVFEIFSAHGTNIILEGEDILIIPRFNGDSLFELPRSDGAGLEEIYEKLSKQIAKVSKAFQEMNDENSTGSDKIVSDDSNGDDKYVSENEVHKKETYSTKKKAEDSLDALLEHDLQEKPYFGEKVNPLKDNDDVEFVRGEDISVEKKEEEKERGEDVIVEENDVEKDVEKHLEDYKKEELASNNVDFKENNESKNLPEDFKTYMEDKDESKDKSFENSEELENLKRNNSEKNVGNLAKLNHIPESEIYRDEKIVVYVENDSEVKGEVVIRPLEDKRILDMEDNDLTYMSLFSKVFASSLFEVMESHGTNVIWDYGSNCIRIIPRYQNDNLKLNWDPKTTSDEFLEQVRTKLISEMNKEISSIGGDEENGSGEEELSKMTEAKKEKIKSSSEKAKYILDYLNKIP